MATAIFVPKTELDVSAEWLTATVSAAVNRPVSLRSLEKETDKKGLLSTVFRANLIVDGVELRLFIKVLPSDESHRGFVLSTAMDVTEIEAYRTIFAELDCFTRDQGGSPDILVAAPRMICCAYDGSGDKHGFFLALEDISTKGYIMADFNQGLRKEQVVAALDKIAKLHAVSLAFSKSKDIELKRHFNSLSNISSMFPSETEKNEYINTNFDLFLQNCASEEGPVRQRALRVKQFLLSAQASKIRNAPLEALCLVHGDLWANNVMFRKDDDDCLIVDWQFLTSGTVFLDVGTLAFLSMDPESTEKNMADFLDAYHRSFEETCSAMGRAELLPWGKHEFLELCARKGLLDTLEWSIMSFDINNMYPAFAARVGWIITQVYNNCQEFIME